VVRDSVDGRITVMAMVHRRRWLRPVVRRSGRILTGLGGGGGRVLLDRIVRV